jgi:hypothetical protein
MGSRDALSQVQEDIHDAGVLLEPASPEQADALTPLLQQRMARLDKSPLPEVMIGELIALADDGFTPMIMFPGQPGTSALRARSIVDLRGVHIGRPVVLSFEGGNPSLPVVMGVLAAAASPLESASGAVELDADGKRMLVTAKEELVLRCGKASITLTKAGKVLIEGTYLSSKSSGANRIKGGSIQLN